MPVSSRPLQSIPTLFVPLTLATLCFAFTISGAAAQQLPFETAAKIDEIATKALLDSSTPSVTIAVVQGGKIVYEKAFGRAVLDPVTDATPQMRYAIGSVSKQFLSAAVMLLVQEGRLSLDDHVSKYLPDLTRSNEITLRELLSHTAGYEDYYPQDYLPPYMQKPITTQEILDEYAKKRLDFDPGTRWQYSNTNYVVAGRIIEIVSGQPLFTFISERILKPLGMTSAINLDAQPLGSSDATGYTRAVDGPPRVVRHEGAGWLYAAGELAMTAHDLALWDIALMKHDLLTPASLDAMMTPARLRNGTPLSYALGVEVWNTSGHPEVAHDGAVAGFTSWNSFWPDQGVAVSAIANIDGSWATSSISNQVARLLLTEEDDTGADKALEQAQQIFEQLAEGKIDRSLLTSDTDAYFTAQVLQDISASLKSLGPATSWRQTSREDRGGMTYRHFEIRFKNKTLRLHTLALPDGKLEEYLID